MANIEDCPGFETFGADVKAARKAKRLSRKTMAEIINVDARYLANIENDGTIPSLPVVIQLIKECGLPVERYFNPEIMREESAQRQRISHKQRKKRGMCESILCFPFCQRAARLSYFFALFAEKSRILRAVGRVGSVLVAEKKKRSKHRKCSHTSENRPAPVPAGRGRLLVGESPKPLFRKDGE